MSDVTDILGVQRPQPIAGVMDGLATADLGIASAAGAFMEKGIGRIRSNAPKVSDTLLAATSKSRSLIAGVVKQKKNKQLPREVIALTRDFDDHPINLAQSAVTSVPSAIKDRKKALVHWRVERIKSSARRKVTGKPEDDLDIHHWTRVDTLDYRYAKANKIIRFLKYTDDEYKTLLENPFWTREETDRLMCLCRAYDLRFLVIHDRLPMPKIEGVDTEPSLEASSEQSLSLTGGSENVMIATNRNSSELTPNDGSMPSFEQLSAMGKAKSVSDHQPLLFVNPPAVINRFPVRRKVVGGSERKIQESGSQLSMCDSLESVMENQSIANSEICEDIEEDSEHMDIPDLQSFDRKENELHIPFDTFDNPSQVILEGELERLLYKPPFKGYSWTTFAKAEDEPGRSNPKRIKLDSERSCPADETEAYLFEYGIFGKEVTNHESSSLLQSSSSSGSLGANGGEVEEDNQPQINVISKVDDEDNDKILDEKQLSRFGRGGGRAEEEEKIEEKTTKTKGGGSRALSRKGGKSQKAQAAKQEKKKEKEKEADSVDSEKTNVDKADLGFDLLSAAKPLVDLQSLIDLLRTKSLESMKHRFYLIQEILRTHRDSITQSNLAAIEPLPEESVPRTQLAQVELASNKELSRSLANEGSKENFTEVLPSAAGVVGVTGVPPYLQAEPCGFNPAVEVARRRHEDRTTLSKLIFERDYKMKQETEKYDEERLGLGAKRARVKRKRMEEVQKIMKENEDKVPEMKGDIWEMYENYDAVDQLPSLVSIKSESEFVKIEPLETDAMGSDSINLVLQPTLSTASHISNNSTSDDRQIGLVASSAMSSTSAAEAAAAKAAAAETAAAVAAARSKFVFCKSVLIHTGPPVETPDNPLLLKWSIENPMFRYDPVEPTLPRSSYYSEVDLKLAEGEFGLNAVHDQALSYLGKNKRDRPDDEEMGFIIEINDPSHHMVTPMVPSLLLKNGAAVAYGGPQAPRVSPLDEMIASTIGDFDEPREWISTLSTKKPALYEKQLSSHLEVLENINKNVDSAMRTARKILVETQKIREKEEKINKRLEARERKLARRRQGGGRGRRKLSNPANETEGKEGEEDTVENAPQIASEAKRLNKTKAQRLKGSSIKSSDENDEQKTDEVTIEATPVSHSSDLQESESLNARTTVRSRMSLMERRPKSIFDDHLPDNPGCIAPPMQATLDAVRIVSKAQEDLCNKFKEYEKKAVERELKETLMEKVDTKPLGPVKPFESNDLLAVNWSKYAKGAKVVSMVKKVAEASAGLGHMLSLFTDSDMIMPVIFHERFTTFSQTLKSDEKSGEAAPKPGVFLQSDISSTLRAINYTALENHPLSTAAPSAARAAVAASVAASGMSKSSDKSNKLATHAETYYSLPKRTVDTLMVELGLKRVTPFKVSSSKTHELFDSVRAQALQCLALQHWVHLRRKLRDDLRMAKGVEAIPAAPPGSTIFPTTVPPNLLLAADNKENK